MHPDEKRLRGEACVIQSAADHDWSYFEEHVEELEEAILRKAPKIIRAAAGLVIVQIYLNKITRSFEEFDEGQPDDLRVR